MSLCDVVGLRALDLQGPGCETSLCAAFPWCEQMPAEKAASVFGRASNIFQFGSVLISGDD